MTQPSTQSTPTPFSEPPARVSMLEVFFDLVFVFTITQLTKVLADDVSVRGFVRVLLMFGVIWWMYGGYVWMSNSVALNSRVRRFVLMAGMAGFLVLALAIPKAFEGDGALFGVAYLVINLVHMGLFTRTTLQETLRPLAWLAPLNLLSAGLVLLAGFLHGTPEYVALAAAIAVQLATPYLNPIRQFRIRPTHFVERHELVVIIAFGESLLAMGIGVAGLDLDFGLVAACVVGLVLTYHLYWAYFGDRPDLAERALERASDRLRTRLVIQAFGYAHYPLVIGIITFAAGVKKAIGHYDDGLYAKEALLLAGGAALFLIGQIWLRVALGIAVGWVRPVAVLLMLATVAVGTWMSVAQMIVMIAVCVAMFISEGRLSRAGELRSLEHCEPSEPDSASSRST